jgi:regulation of enolase protein 1 (concanavalin A-like superfamily)
MHWLNEPPIWRAEGESLRVSVGPKTDFWRKTHYGFIRDSGHFFYQEVSGDIQCDVLVRGEYAARYDQAGLMVRADAETWMKCGIEFVDGAQYASVVVTRDYSDWSVVLLEGAPAALWLRVVRRSEALEVYCSLDGAAYRMLRLAHLTDAPRLQIGPMCAAPDGPGFQVSFEQLRLSAPSEGGAM